MQAKYMLNCINIVYSFNPIMIAQEQKNLGIPFGNLQVIFKANTLYIQASASFIKHPLFPLCVCFEIVLDNLFGVVILFYPLSSTKLSIFICKTSLLHTTLLRSFFHFVFANFRQFCQFLEQMKTDDANPETLVSFLNMLLCSLVMGPDL